MEPTAMLGVMLLLWLLIAIKAGFIGMAILIQHVMPGFIERSSEYYRKKPRWRALLLGLINGAAIPFIAILLISTEVLALPGLLLLVLYLWLTLLSYTVIYRWIGSNLFKEVDTNREVKITLFGGMIAEAAFLVPLLGQVCSMVLFIQSLGAVSLAILSRNRKAEQLPEDAD